MSWLENRILTGNLIFAVPTMTLFQNLEKLEIVLSTYIVNLASHDGTIILENSVIMFRILAIFRFKQCHG